MIKKVTNTIYYIGVNDHKIDLFEGQYQVLMVFHIIPI